MVKGQKVEKELKVDEEDDNDLRGPARLGVSKQSNKVSVDHCANEERKSQEEAPAVVEFEPTVPPKQAS